MLKDVKLTVAMGNKILYQRDFGFHGSCQRTKRWEFWKSGQKGSMKFRLEIPAEWDNRMAQKKTDVTWIFTVNEEEKTSSSDSTGGSGKRGKYCPAGSDQR